MLAVGQLMPCLRPVVAQEDVLEVVLAGADRQHLVGGRGLDDGVGGSLESDRHGSPVGVASVTPGSARNSSASTGAANSISRRWMATLRRFSSESTTTSRPSAKDRQPVGHALDLRQGVRGEEHRAALGADLAEQRVKALLHERIETGDRLVQDQQLGLVHERLDQAELLSVAGRQLADRAIEIGVEPLGQRVAHARGRRRRGARAR